MSPSASTLLLVTQSVTSLTRGGDSYVMMGTAIKLLTTAPSRRRWISFPQSECLSVCWKVRGAAEGGDISSNKRRSSRSSVNKWDFEVVSRFIIVLNPLFCSVRGGFVVIVFYWSGSRGLRTHIRVCRDERVDDFKMCYFTHSLQPPPLLMVMMCREQSLCSGPVTVSLLGSNFFICPRSL